MMQPRQFVKEKFVNLTINERKILLELVKNSRISDVDLSHKLKITSQAVNKIRKKLESKGIIKKYHIEINPKIVNNPIFCLLLIKIEQNNSSTNAKVYLERISIYVRKIHLSNGSYISLIRFDSFSDLRENIDLIRKQYNSEITIEDIFIFNSEDIIKDCKREFYKKIIKEYNKKNSLILPDLREWEETKQEIKIKQMSNNEKGILSILSTIGRINYRRILDKLNNLKLSDKGIQKIICRLEKKGIINGYTIHLDHKKLDVKTSVVIFLKRKNGFWSLKDGWHKWVRENPHITECYRSSESNNYILIGHFKDQETVENYLQLVDKQIHQYIEIEKIYFLTNS